MFGSWLRVKVPKSYISYFESPSKKLTNIAPDCDPEPFLGRAPIGTLGPRLLAQNSGAPGLKWLYQAFGANMRELSV